MDWFMLTAMVIAGWAVVSVLAGERMNRLQQLTAHAAAAASKPPAAEPTAAPRAAA